MKRKSGLNRRRFQPDEEPRVGQAEEVAPTPEDDLEMFEADPSVVIRTVGLTKRYGTRTAVDSLNLEIRRGEIFGLLGPNGAGKTTTVLMLLGLTEPTAGRRAVLGLDPARHPLLVKRRVGYMPDNVGFYGNLTGRENLRYTARLNGIRDRDARPRIEEVLAQVGLVSRADDRTEGYSRGMRQRLGIADALVKDPEILILDEPTTAIDPIGVVEILELIRSLARDRDFAILLASHLLDQVQSVCHRVGIFHDGHVIGQGSVDDLANEFGEGGNHLDVGVERSASLDPVAVRAVLAGVAGVTAVAPLDDAAGHDAWRLTIGPERDESEVGRDVIDRVLAAGLRLERFGRARPSLEQIYRRAVERVTEVAA